MKLDASVDFRAVKWRAPILKERLLVAWLECGRIMLKRGEAMPLTVWISSGVHHLIMSLVYNRKTRKRDRS